MGRRQARQPTSLPVSVPPAWLPLNRRSSGRARHAQISIEAKIPELLAGWTCVRLLHDLERREDELALGRCPRNLGLTRATPKFVEHTRECFCNVIVKTAR